MSLWYIIIVWIGISISFIGTMLFLIWLNKFGDREKMTIADPVHFRDPEDPVHQKEDSKWYWWDECWAFEEGPYDTEEEARQNWKEYCKEYLKKED